MISFVCVAHGSLHLPSETYQTYFAGLDGVVLQRRAEHLIVLPVRHAPAGGYLIKQRNVRGDRVINAGDFLRSHGLGDELQIRAPAIWDASEAGLVLHGVFSIHPETE